MGLFSKLFKGYFYVVDLDTLKQYLQKELDFSLENNLEASADLNIYLNGDKHHIQIWNYSASNFEKEKGLIIYYDDIELKTLDELYSNYLNNINGYFKIELITIEDEFLEEYKKNHPELKIEDYN